MPDARGHDLITVLTGVAMIPTSYGLFAATDPEQAPVKAGLLFGAHLLSGMMFSPDLDLDSAIDDRWGLFGWIWRPYTMVIPHRHYWSHGLILPPILRLGYFLAVLMLLLFGMARALAAFAIVVPDYHERLASAISATILDHPEETMVFLFGFVTGGAAHSIADWLVTGGKRYLAMLGYRPRRSYANHDRSLHRRGWYG